MKQIHILQLTVVVTFALFCIVGLAVLFLLPDRMDKYNQLCATVFPFFIAVVVPAMFGKPVTEGVRNLTAKNGTYTLPGVPQ